MESWSDLLKIAENRILVFNGAFGTYSREIVGSKLLPDLLNVTDSEIVGRIHREYLDAGADIITTNTINSNSVSGQRFDFDLSNELAVKTAERSVKDFLASGKPKFVAGSVGPAAITISERETANKNGQRLFEAYRQQCRILIESEINILLFETMIASGNIRIALRAAERAFEETCRNLPIWLSIAPVKAEEELITGERISDFITSLDSEFIKIVGLNCTDDFVLAERVFENLASRHEFLISFAPSRGIPDASGIYPSDIDEIISKTAAIMERRLLNIVGGCCGTTPEYIRRLNQRMKGVRPRPFRNF